MPSPVPSSDPTLTFSPTRDPPAPSPSSLPDPTPSPSARPLSAPTPEPLGSPTPAPRLTPTPAGTLSVTASLVLVVTSAEGDGAAGGPSAAQASALATAVEANAVPAGCSLRDFKAVAGGASARRLLARTLLLDGAAPASSDRGDGKDPSGTSNDRGAPLGLKRGLAQSDRRLEPTAWWHLSFEVLNVAGDELALISSWDLAYNVEFGLRSPGFEYDASTEAGVAVTVDQSTLVVYPATRRPSARPSSSPVSGPEANNEDDEANAASTSVLLLTGAGFAVILLLLCGTRAALKRRAASEVATAAAWASAAKQARKGEEGRNETKSLGQGNILIGRDIELGRVHGSGSAMVAQAEESPSNGRHQSANMPAPGVSSQDASCIAFLEKINMKDSFPSIKAKVGGSITLEDLCNPDFVSDKMLRDLTISSFQIRRFRGACREHTLGSSVRGKDVEQFIAPNAVTMLPAGQQGVML